MALMLKGALTDRDKARGVLQHPVYDGLAGDPFLNGADVNVLVVVHK